MFKTYVLPILECGCPIYNPYYAKDIDLLEKVQRDFTRLVYKRSPKYQQNNQIIPSYPERLSMFNLELLELRRLKICLDLFHQYLHGLIPSNHHQSFQILRSKTRGESYKITSSVSTKDVRFNSFTNL
jgi:hypothetical protein